VHGLLASIEGSPLGQIVREAGPWAYALVNLTHILGIASLFGAVLLLDLWLLGVRGGPLRPLALVAVPVARGGFLLAALSGIALISANATEYAGNPFLLIKFPAIGVALLNALMLERSSAWKDAIAASPHADAGGRLRVMGGVSLVSWLAAISAGRLIGYW
jgi:hypothetical protein